MILVLDAACPVTLLHGLDYLVIELALQVLARRGSWRFSWLE
jgi:hypothetical protein